MNPKKLQNDWVSFFEDDEDSDEAKHNNVVYHSIEDLRTFHRIMQNYECECGEEAFDKVTLDLNSDARERAFRKSLNTDPA